MDSRETARPQGLSWPCLGPGCWGAWRAQGYGNCESTTLSLSQPPTSEPNSCPHLFPSAKPWAPAAPWGGSRCSGGVDTGRGSRGAPSSSPAFATPLWRAECLGQENGVWENWVVYIFQQGRKHTFFILLLQTCVPHRWWEQEAHTWRPGRQGVWAGASFSCCSRGNSAWCSELVQMGPKAALLLSRNMASGMWILCSSASQT